MTQPTSRPLFIAGTVLGIGLGGFVDGILLHQIVQLHAMLSARVPLDTMHNMQTNMTADGLFHGVMWLVTLAGVALLFRAGKRAEVPWSGRVLTGAMIFGWGIFNVAEGVIDHHILHVHHVVERLGPSIWDWLFLGVSRLLIAAGWLIAKEPRRP
ncbi:MAG TPA: DUF2243 domain-containing protein [Sphingomicrobium sp.]|jgi:uncharacterized membrane protein